MTEEVPRSGFEKFTITAIFRSRRRFWQVQPVRMHSNTKTPQILFSEFVGRSHFSDLLTACAIQRDSFLTQYVPMAERLAMCVQNLPLSPSVCSHPGGALQFGLQAGLLAVRSCDAVIFAPKATAQERQRDDPLYRWCAYCATLASAYLMCAGAVEVTLADGHRHSFAGRFTLGELNTKFTAKWRDEPALPQQSGLIYVQTFFYPGQFSHLSPALLNQLGAAINPAMVMSGTESPLAKVVRMSLSRVLEFLREQEAQTIAGQAASVMVDIPVAVANGPVHDPLRPESYSQHATAPASPAPSSPASPVTVSAPAPSSAAATQSTGGVGATPPKATTPAASSAAVNQATANSSPPSPTPPAQSETPPAVAAPDITHGIPIKVVEWIRALAFGSHPDVEVLEGGNLKIGRKALGFAALPAANYTALYEAKCVVEKLPDGSAICNANLTAIYQQAKASKKQG